MRLPSDISISTLAIYPIPFCMCRSLASAISVHPDSLSEQLTELFHLPDPVLLHFIFLVAFFVLLCLEHKMVLNTFTRHTSIVTLH